MGFTPTAQSLATSLGLSCHCSSLTCRQCAGVVTKKERRMIRQVGIKLRMSDGATVKQRGSYGVH